MPETPTLSPDLTDEERIELTAMHALLVQNELAYVRFAYKNGVVTKRGGGEVTNWYQTVDDERCKGWQSALNALAHTYGETSSLYHQRARARRAESTRKPSQPTGIVAWETEHPSAVVWGTHDPQLARDAWVKWCAENGLDAPYQEIDWSVAIKCWASPETDTEQEIWPSEWISSMEVPGWTPYLVVI